MKTLASAIRIKGSGSGPTAKGQLQKNTYMPIGQWQFFYPRTSKLWQAGKYNELGQKTGVWKVYSEDGILALEITYSRSKPTKVQWRKGAVDLGYVMTSDIFFVPGVELEMFDEDTIESQI